MSEVFDDENYDDGFDEDKLSKRFNVDLWKKLRDLVKSNSIEWLEIAKQRN